VKNKMADNEKMKLEEIAKQTAGMEKKVDMDQIVNSAIDEISTFNSQFSEPDERGFTKYKTEFNKDERKSLAERIYKCLALNSLRIHMPNYSKAELEKFINEEDPTGDKVVDEILESNFGFSFASLLDASDNEKFNQLQILALATQSGQQYQKKLTSKKALNLLAKNDYNPQEIYDFIKKTEEDKKLDRTPESIIKKPQQLYKRFIELAEHYK